MGKKKNAVSIEKWLRHNKWLPSIIPIIVALYEKNAFNLIAAARLQKYGGGQLLEQILSRNLILGMLGYFMLIAIGIRIYQGMQQKDGVIKWLILPLVLLLCIEGVVFFLNPRPNLLLDFCSEMVMLYLFSLMLPGLVDAIVHFYKQEGWLKRHAPVLVAYLGIYIVLVPAVVGDACTVYALMIH